MRIESRIISSVSSPVEELETFGETLLKRSRCEIFEPPLPERSVDLLLSTNLTIRRLLINQSLYQYHLDAIRDLQIGYDLSRTSQGLVADDQRLDQYLDWSDGMTARSLAIGPVLDICLHGAALSDVDARWRKRKGWARQHLVKAVDLFSTHRPFRSFLPTAGTRRRLAVRNPVDIGSPAL
ncbi:MAG: hypothetical protein AAGF15_01315 [Pseudomonadota bacterium]